MTRPAEFDRQLLAVRGQLYAFCVKLTMNKDDANELMQDVIAQALAKHHQFALGTNMAGWLIMMARNLFYSQVRQKRRRGEVMLSITAFEDVAEDKMNFAFIEQPGAQEPTLHLKQVSAELDRMPRGQVDALVLVAQGHSYEDASKILRVQAGTIKSRINRGREHLMRACA